MSAHDAGYLTRETAVQPLHYVVQLDLEARVSFDDVRTDVARRLGGLPLAHRRTRYPLLAGRPVWVDDPEFHVDRQLTQWPQELRDHADAAAAFAEITARRLPRDRPLWNLTVADGPGDRTTVWLSVHHSMMDGMLLTQLFHTLFPATDVDVPPAYRPVRPPSRLWLLIVIFLRRLQRLVVKEKAESSTPAAAQSETRPTSMTGPVSAARAMADTTVSLDDVKAVRKQTGATINDLFLAVVAEALRGYLDPVPDFVLGLIPRNIRTESESGAIGNRAWSMLVPLPTGDADPDARLASIRTATEAGKAMAGTSGTQGWRFDVALTNVPFGGPFAIVGRLITHLRATVPLQGENRLVGVLTTYDGRATISYTADGNAYPDMARLADLTQQAWQRMFATSNA